MIKSKNVVAALRRDATYVWHAAIAVVFIVFAGLATGEPPVTAPQHWIDRYDVACMRCSDSRAAVPIRQLVLDPIIAH